MARRPAPRTGRRPRRPNLVLVVLLCGLFFLAAAAGHGPLRPPERAGDPPRLVDAVRQVVAQRASPRRSASPSSATRCGSASSSPLGTVVLTLGLLLPDRDLGAPAAARGSRPVIEFLTVLPYVIPADRARRRHQGGPAARPLVPRTPSYSLIPFYVVLALPFTYRSIDAGIRAIDLRTLVDASRSLGAGWGTTLAPSADPQPAHRDHLVGVPDRRRRARRVHDRRRAAARHACRRSWPSTASREPQGGYGLALLALVVDDRAVRSAEPAHPHAKRRGDAPSRSRRGLEPAAA